MANILEHLKNKEFTKVLDFCIVELEKTPTDYNLFVIRGFCLFHLGQQKEAEQWLQEAVNSNNLHAISIKLVQDVFFLSNQYDKIIVTTLLYIDKYPHDVDLWYRLALARALIGQTDPAIEDFSHLVSFSSHAKAKVHLAILLFKKNNFAKGLPFYEERFSAYEHCNWFNNNEWGIPLWKGEALTGKSLLLWSEQGLGDVIQFIRFATVLAQQGVKVSLLLKETHRTLAGLMKTVEGIEQVYLVSKGHYQLPSTIDYHCSLMSLLHRFDLRQHTIPAFSPYVFSSGSHHSIWEFLRANNKIKVGLVWSTETPVDGYEVKEKMGLANQQKNIALQQLAPIFSLETLSFFTLQYVINDADQQYLYSNNITNLSDKIKTFDDTAAIIANMDLVISIDTSVVHLAGALNKPTINLLPHVDDWRWRQAENDQSSWYPSMTLLRQPTRGDWGSVVEKLLVKLKTFMHTGELSTPSRADRL